MLTPIAVRRGEPSHSRPVRRELRIARPVQFEDSFSQSHPADSKERHARTPGVEEPCLGSPSGAPLARGTMSGRSSPIHGRQAACRARARGISLRRRRGQLPTVASDPGSLLRRSCGRVPVDLRQSLKRGGGSPGSCPAGLIRLALPADVGALDRTCGSEPRRSGPRGKAFRVTGRERCSSADAILCNR